MTRFYLPQNWRRKWKNSGYSLPHFFIPPSKYDDITPAYCTDNTLFTRYRAAGKNLNQVIGLIIRVWPDLGMLTSGCSDSAKHRLAKNLTPRVLSFLPRTGCVPTPATP